MIMQKGKAAWVALGIALSLVVLAVHRNSAQGEDDSVADRPKEDENANVRYVRTALELARIRLQEAKEANQRMPHTLPDTVLSRLDRNVRVAEERLKAALDPSIRAFHAENLLLAQHAVDDAKDEHQRAIQANKKAPGSVGKTKLERFRLELEAARLNLEREQGLGADSAARLTEVQWQMDMLRDEVRRLRSTVEQLSDLN